MRAAWPAVPPVAETERCNLLRLRLCEDRLGRRYGRWAALPGPHRAAAEPRGFPDPDQVALGGVGGARRTAPARCAPVRSASRDVTGYEPPSRAILAVGVTAQ